MAMVPESEGGSVCLWVGWRVHGEWDHLSQQSTYCSQDVSLLIVGFLTALGPDIWLKTEKCTRCMKLFSVLSSPVVCQCCWACCTVKEMPERLDGKAAFSDRFST